MNWKPGNWEQQESDLSATDGQSFLLLKPGLGLCKTSTASFSVGSGRSQLANCVSGSPLHQKLTSLTAGAEAPAFSAGSLYLRNDSDDQLGCLVNCSDYIADRYLHLLPLHPRKSRLQGARQLGTAVF